MKATLFLLVAVAAPAAAGQLSITIGATERSYVLHLPNAREPSYPAPLVAVELYAIEGQGHAWPGGRNGLRYGSVDAPSTEISATDVMWQFFAQHAKR